MAISSKNSKEMFVVCYKEIPENICVQTKFITKAAALQNKYDNLYYLNLNQGQMDLSSCDSSSTTLASTQQQSLSYRRRPAVSVNVKSNGNCAAPLTITSVMPNINVQSTQAFTTAPTVGQGIAYKPLPMTIGVSTPYNATNIIGAGPHASNASASTSLSTVTIPFSSPILQSGNFSTSVLMKSFAQTKDTGCVTDPKPQCIDREQQTPILDVASIGIQCCMDEDFDEEIQLLPDLDGTSLPHADESSTECGKEEFLQYVGENSIEYKNHLRECQICGEVCKSSKYFYGHMAVHRGPKCLCYLCGQYLEHESLLKTHNCVGTKRKLRALLRCPYKRCNIVAVSRLELYDHINEHNGYRMHKCSACCKSFCTVQEFLRHLLLRAKCYTEAKRNRNRLYGLRAKMDRICRVRIFTLHSYSKRMVMVKNPLKNRTAKSHLCEICCRSYRSEYIYKRHVKKCFAYFRKQTNRKNKRKKV